MIEHCNDVIASMGLRIRCNIVRHTGRWVATGIERNATIAAGKIPHLRFPTALVASKLVNKYDRRTAPRLFKMQLSAVLGERKGHRYLQ